MAWKRKIRFTMHAPFGRCATLYEAFKKKNIDVDCIIICINRGGGWVPVKFLLPHQFYEDDLKKFQEGIGDTYHGEICAFPVDAKSYVTIAKQEYA